MSVSNPITGKRYNIGLNLKFENKQKMALGYARKSERGWEYSQLSIDLISKYQKKFPVVFDVLRRKSDKNMFDDKDFFPFSDGENEMEIIVSWLKTSGVDKLETISCGKMVLPKVLKFN